MAIAHHTFHTYLVALDYFVGDPRTFAFLMDKLAGACAFPNHEAKHGSVRHRYANWYRFTLAISATSELSAIRTSKKLLERGLFMQGISNTSRLPKGLQIACFELRMSSILGSLRGGQQVSTFLDGKIERSGFLANLKNGVREFSWSEKKRVDYRFRNIPSAKRELENSEQKRILRHMSLKELNK